MARLLTSAALVVVFAFSSIGCCAKCGSCGHGGHGGCFGYWRNLGLPGKHPVGKACCRKCDLCDDVGGPCGGWSQTSGGGSGTCESCGAESELIAYPMDEMIPTTQKGRVYSAPQTARVIRGNRR